MTDILTPQARLHLATQQLAAAERDFQDAALAFIAAHIREVYPQARTVRGKGEWNEDMLLRFYPSEVLDADGQIVADSSDDAWEDLIDLLYDEFLALAERDSSLEGESEIPLPDPVESFLPVLLVYGNPAEGFTYVGPVTPNDPDLDHFVDTGLRNVTWWYVPLRTLPEVSAESEE